MILMSVKKAPPSRRRPRSSRSKSKGGKGQSRPAVAVTGKRAAATASKPASTASAGPRRWPVILLAGSIWLLVGAGGLFAWFIWDLPDPEAAAARSERRPSISVLARDRTLLLQVGDIHGRQAQLADLPPYLPRAVLATEDRRFYTHTGIDPIGLLRAIWVNVRAGGVRQGGSTLSQQLAKNLFLTRARTWRRKIQELLLAFWLEDRFSKDQILTLYLNRVYLGAGAYGVEAAAMRYFGRSAAKLDLWQAAVLAGLPRAPSALNPFVAPERAAARARQVLDNMVAAGWLDPATAEAAKRPTVITRDTGRAGRNRRWFADWALARAGDLMGGIDRDIVIVTTLEPAMQRAAEAAASETGPGARADGASQMALVAMRPDGAVVAMLGGYQRRTSAFNRATQARRQPGSAFKPLVYLAGIEAGLTPDSLIDARDVDVGGWVPRNAGDVAHWPMSLREGAARSVNTVAVWIAEHAGRDKVIAMARRLGLTGALRPDPALALGVHEVTPLELTTAYATLAAGGYAATAHAILRIEGADGSLLYRRAEDTAPRVLAARSISAIHDLLEAAISHGTGRAARPDNRPAAGKTGTTQNNRDAWFAGYTHDLVAAVWMGNDDATPTGGVSGGLHPARLWRHFMNRAHAGLPARELRRPAD